MTLMIMCSGIIERTWWNGYCDISPNTQLSTSEPPRAVDYHFAELSLLKIEPFKQYNIRPASYYVCFKVDPIRFRMMHDSPACIHIDRTAIEISNDFHSRTELCYNRSQLWAQSSEFYSATHARLKNYSADQIKARDIQLYSMKR